MHQRVPPSLAGTSESAPPVVEVSPPHFAVIQPRAVAAANLWHKKRSAVRFEAGDLTLSITPGSRDTLPAHEVTRHICLAAGDMSASISVPVSLVSKILESYGLPPGRMPRDYLIVLLLEHRFAEAI